MEFKNLRVKDIRFVVKYISSVKRWNAKNRTDHIIGIQIKGKATHDLGYKTFDISENSIYFLNSKDDYSVEVLGDENTYAYSVHFTTYEPIATDSFCVNVNNKDEFINLLDKIKVKSDLSEDNAMLSYFYKFCSLFNETLKKYAPKGTRFKKVKEYIDLHFKEENCFKEAVNISGVTQRRFNDIFKNTFGITPNRYIVTRKINFAKELLLLSNVSVTDAAYLSGFSDIYYFSKVFKNETGVSPTKFKKGM